MRLISLANSSQARKRARQGAANRAQNMAQRASMRTHIKKHLKALDDSNTETATNTYRVAVSKIDRAARKGLHHPNKAARLKSRLHARMKATANT